ncbi:MAG: hypothetical protein JWP06_265 [Candidatus Saccharibacteria bacterium]|nr:hypothetical protein [Candidatus Saccharibacteria bacterium]
MKNKKRLKSEALGVLIHRVDYAAITPYVAKLPIPFPSFTGPPTLQSGCPTAVGFLLHPREESERSSMYFYFWLGIVNVFQEEATLLDSSFSLPCK